MMCVILTLSRAVLFLKKLFFFFFEFLFQIFFFPFSPNLVANHTPISSITPPPAMDAVHSFLLIPRVLSNVVKTLCTSALGILD